MAVPAAAISLMLAMMLVDVGTTPPHRTCAEPKSRRDSLAFWQQRLRVARHTPRMPRAADLEWDETLLDVQPLGHSAYLDALELYAAVDPVKAVLVVTGPRNVGKSFGLAAAAAHWRRQGRAVLEINLKSVAQAATTASDPESLLGTLETRLRIQIRQLIATALTERAFSLDELTKVHHCLREQLPDGSLRGLRADSSPQPGSFLTRLLTGIPTLAAEWCRWILRLCVTGCGRNRGFLLEPRFACASGSARGDPGAGSLVPAATTLPAYHRHPRSAGAAQDGSAGDADAGPVARRVCRLQTGSSTGAHHLRDFRFGVVGNRDRMHDATGNAMSFHQLEVGPMHYDETRFVLVNHWGLLTQTEFEYAWSLTRGFGSHLAMMLHEWRGVQMLGGMQRSFKDVADRTRKELFRPAYEMLPCLACNETLFNGVQSVLKQLRNSAWILPANRILNHPTSSVFATWLLDRTILYTSFERSTPLLRPSHRVLQVAIAKWLTETPHPLAVGDPDGALRQTPDHFTPFDPRHAISTPLPSGLFQLLQY